MNRLFLRLVKKAGLPIWHTEGFNPHPYITFAVPLSLGFESDYDILDIKLTDDNFNISSVASKLADVAPKGIEFVKSFAPVMKYGDIFSADFRVVFFNPPSDFYDKLLEFSSRQSIEVLKKRKNGKMDTIDISSKILSSSVLKQGSDVVFDITLPAGSNENVNPMLFIGAFIEENPDFYLVCRSIVRGNIYNKKGEVFK